MKTINQALLFTLIPFVAILASCDKDSDKISSKKLLPYEIKITTNDNGSGGVRSTIRRLSYDEQNRIEKFSVLYWDGSVTQKILSYADDNIIQVSTVSEKWNNGNIDIYQAAKGVLYIYNIPHGTVDENFNLLSIEFPYNSPIIYEYDKRGNIQSETSYPGGVARTRYYTNDGRNGMFRHVQTPAWFLLVSNFRLVPNLGLFNNPAIEYNDNGPEYPVYSFDYIYNDDDYPTVLMKNFWDYPGSYYERYDISYIEAN